MMRTCTLALVGLLSLGGCLEIEGGAVEVAWVIRDSRQRAVKCDSEGLRLLGTSIARVRLQIQPAYPTGEVGGDLCASGTVKGCEFTCRSLGGTTPFSVPVPEGEDAMDYFFSLLPLTGDGSPLGPDLVEVPPPMRRTVRRGDLTDLGLWMLVVPAKEEVLLQ